MVLKNCTMLNFFVQLGESVTDNSSFDASLKGWKLWSQSSTIISQCSQNSDMELSDHENSRCAFVSPWNLTDFPRMQNHELNSSAKIEC